MTRGRTPDGRLWATVEPDPTGRWRARAEPGAMDRRYWIARAACSEGTSVAAVGFGGTPREALAALESGLGEPVAPLCSFCGLEVVAPHDLAAWEPNLGFGHAHCVLR